MWGDVPTWGRGSEGEGTVPLSPGSLPWFLLSPSPSLSPCLSCCLELAVFGFSVSLLGLFFQDSPLSCPRRRLVQASQRAEGPVRGLEPEARVCP